MLFFFIIKTSYYFRNRQNIVIVGFEYTNYQKSKLTLISVAVTYFNNEIRNLITNRLDNILVIISTDGITFVANTYRLHVQNLIKTFRRKPEQLATIGIDRSNVFVSRVTYGLAGR